MKEKNGRVKAFPIKNVSGKTLAHSIENSVEKGSILHTDEFPAYSSIKGYKKHSINHRKGIYSFNGVSTNGVESMWAVMRRGIYGVYHHVSDKHLDRYVNEFTFRLNEGNVKVHTVDRLNSLIDGMEGHRLTYKKLIK